MMLKKYYTLFLAAIQRSTFCPNRVRCFILKRMGWALGSDCVILPGTTAVANNVILDDGAYLGPNLFLDDHAGIHVGKESRIGPYSYILTRTHPINDFIPRRTHGLDIDLPVTIGRGCWLGAHVVILPGVSVGEGCVVGAGSVVTKSTEPNGLYVGNPARRIKDLDTRGRTTTEDKMR